MVDELRLTDAEWAVMQALWDGAPATARDLKERIDAEWAYTTVKTLLQRLVDKGAVQVELRGNTGWYTPIWQKAAARRSAIRSLLDSAFEGSFGGLFQHLARDERLTESQRAELLAMLEASGNDRSSRRPKGGRPRRER
ncbi:MAG: BlaI/MecI/CopY family transcriptional regulator [Planctomycetes bacterium]|nr:BlaI/MecI/CopY family transcriptional regulator [Planctomycetota bacterium]